MEHAECDKQNDARLKPQPTEQEGTPPLVKNLEAQLAEQEGAFRDRLEEDVRPHERFVETPEQRAERRAFEDAASTERLLVRWNPRTFHSFKKDCENKQPQPPEREERPWASPTGAMPWLHGAVSGFAEALNWLADRQDGILERLHNLERVNGGRAHLADPAKAPRATFEEADNA